MPRAKRTIAESSDSEREDTQIDTPEEEDANSLYSLLSLAPTATSQEIKSAYRRAALLCHPDKLGPSATPSEVEAANDKFKKVGLAYAVLKDEKRRERYDRTGETEEKEGVDRTEAEWKDYFKELWKGEVNADTIEEFRQKYQGSDEEKTDLFTVYTSSKGDLDTILSSIMCSSIADEDRFISLINSAIASDELVSFPAWKKATKDSKAKEKRAAKAKKEEKEAEEYAKELGVHDKLFGGDKGGKGKKGGKKEEADPEATLRALIQGNHAKRMESMLDSIEAKYGAQEKKGGSKGKGKKRASEPTDEEFARMQEEVDARRKKGKKSKA